MGVTDTVCLKRQNFNAHGGTVTKPLCLDVENYIFNNEDIDPHGGAGIGYPTALRVWYLAGPHVEQDSFSCNPA